MDFKRTCALPLLTLFLLLFGTAAWPQSARVNARPSAAAPAELSAPEAAAPSNPFLNTFSRLLRLLVTLVALLTSLYGVRHYGLTSNRLFGVQRHPFVNIESVDWPKVAVFVAAHNEEAVIADALTALLKSDYPQDRFRIIPVNDRSSDRTREIIDAHAAEFPNLIFPMHRTEGKAGKAAALKDATAEHEFGEIIIVFDADYIPLPGLLKLLVSPFLDPEVGAVMGRVVPLNVNQSLLTAVLELERSAGYQVDQQARMNLSLVPLYGGTVGGLRRSALAEVGGWNDNALAEDTEITFRLLLAGWKTVYQNRAECYEEVPETWPVRIRQISRWAKGHNSVMMQFVPKLIYNQQTSFLEKLDGIMLLGVYAYAPLLLIGWIAETILFFMGQTDYLFVGLFSIAIFGTFGNFATFFQIGAAVRLDGTYRRTRLLPFTFIGFLVSTVVVSKATLSQLRFRKDKKLVWDKTERFRKAA